MNQRTGREASLLRLARMRAFWIFAFAVFFGVAPRWGRAENDRLPELSDRQLRSPSSDPSGPLPDEDSLNELEKVIAEQDLKAPAPAKKEKAFSPDDDLEALESTPPKSGTNEFARSSPAKDGSVDSLSEPTPSDPALAAESVAPPPADPVAAAPPPPPPLSSSGFASDGPAEKNRVSNLEFKTDGGISRIVLTSRIRPTYTESNNAGARQLVYIFENTETPEKLQRAYDTSEFKSPVALFTLLQATGGGTPSSKLIVQLRENATPKVQITERGLSIEFPAIAETERQVASPIPNRQPLSNDNVYGKQAFYGKPIRRLEVKNSEVQDVLRLLARSSGYSVMVGDDVTGKIGTLSLENIPWDQALTLVLQSKKLGYVRDGNVLRIATTEALKNEKNEALTLEQARTKADPLKSILIPVSYGKARDMTERVKPFLSERGVSDVDERTNTLIVKDVEKVIERVQKLISALDTQPARVSISARFVEMRQSFSRKIGTTGFGLSNFPLLGSAVNLSSRLAIPDQSYDLFNTANVNLGNGATLNANLALGEIDNKAKTLANPSLSVVANQTATITQALTFYLQANSVTAGVVTTALVPVTASLSLTVTPIVSQDGTIFMTVAITNQIPNPNGNSSTVDSRNISTQILVENGDTAVIGGIFQNTVTNNREGIPLLMRLPIVGYLFGKDEVIDNRNEIFVFLTAKITNVEDSFRRTI